MEGLFIIRIISGKARGLKLNTLAGNKTRPTSDRVREALFNILNPHIEDSYFLDVFSGSGANFIEALSRGAAFAVSIDSSVKCAKVIESNVQKANFQQLFRMMVMDYKDAFRRLSEEKAKFDIIFIDPPYESGLAVHAAKLADECNLLKETGILVCEHLSREIFPEKIRNLNITDSRKYGNTTLSFYRYL